MVTVCQQKRNGSMHIELEPQLTTIGQTHGILQRQIDIVGTTTIQIVEHRPLKQNCQTPVAYTIWQVMFGNGVMIGMAAIQQMLKQILLDQQLVVTACCVGARGSTTPTTSFSAPASATSSLRTAETTTMGSGWRVVRGMPFYPFPFGLHI